MTTQQTAEIVRNFIEQAWNGPRPAAVREFLAENFVDHDNRTGLNDVEGMEKWIAQTSQTFDHHTTIEDQLTEGDRSFIRLTFKVVQKAEFRGVLAPGKAAETNGYRVFRVEDGKIVEHWGFINGDRLVEQLKAN